MPCYLFTYHTYGSWLPDRPQGYVRRKGGVLPQNTQLARVYRGQMTQGTVSMKDGIQLTAIETLLDAARHIECRIHTVATDNQHIHSLVGWTNEQRKWKQTSASFKKSLTLTLKKKHEDQKWLSRDASHK